MAPLGICVLGGRPEISTVCRRRVLVRTRMAAVTDVASMRRHRSRSSSKWAFTDQIRRPPPN